MLVLHNSIILQCSRLSFAGGLPSKRSEPNTEKRRNADPILNPWSASSLKTQEMITKD